MDKGCLQSLFTSRLHTLRPYLFRIRIARSPCHSPHSRHLAKRWYSSENEDPKLVDQPGVSTDGGAAERSDQLLPSLSPGNLERRSTGASAPFVTPSEDGSRLTRRGKFHQLPPGMADRTCYVLGANRGYIKKLEVYYKVGAADTASVETVFENFIQACMPFHQRMAHAKEATARLLLLESAESVLNKMARTFMTGAEGEPLTPLEAFAEIHSRSWIDLLEYDSSVLDFIRDSERADKAGLEKFLAEYPGLEDCLNMLVDLNLGMHFTAIAPFTITSNQYDNVTMDILQRALDDACPAEQFGDDVRQPIKTVLKCLQDLSTLLKENLFV